MSIRAVLSGRSVRFGNFLSALPNGEYRRTIEDAEKAYVLKSRDIACACERDVGEQMVGSVESHYTFTLDRPLAV